MAAGAPGSGTVHRRRNGRARAERHVDESITDLVEGVLTPLTMARGGAEPLLATLEAYFATGGIATHSARRLHLSVRAVTYRLGRVRALTGYDPTNPADWFTLHAAVLGARLLGWPRRQLTTSG